MSNLVPVEILQRYAATVKARAVTAAPPPSRGERRIASMVGHANASPGSWNSNPYEQLLHFRTIVWQCVNYIAERFAESTPQAVRAADPVTARKHAMQAKSWRMGRGPAPERRMVPRGLIEKTHGPVQPHEDYEFLPPGDPLAKLLVDPNEPDTGFGFWYLAAVFHAMTGECYLYKSRDTARRVESLWVVPSPWMRPVCLGTNRLVEYYQCTPPRGDTTRIDPEDIVRIRRPSPFHPLGAMSATAANAAEIDTYDQISAAQNVTLRNRVNFCGVLRAQEGVGTLTDDTIMRIENALAARHAGPFNSGRPLILEPGWLWESMPEYPDIAMLKSKEEVGNLVIKGYGLDPSVFNSNAATYAAALEIRNKVQLEVIAPLLRLFAETLTERLAHDEFGPDYRVIYPQQPALSTQEHRKNWQFLARTNSVTINERRVAFGLEPRDEPECDMILAPPALMPLGLDEPTPNHAGERDEGEVGDDDDGDDDPREDADDAGP